MNDWQPFPFDSDPFIYAGDSLREAWSGLHAGDRVPYPDREWVVQTLEHYPNAAPRGFDGDVSGLAGLIQSAWRSHHAGEFREAVELADRCGLLAHAAANKASGIYADYLEKDEERQREIYLSAARRAEQAMQALPDDPNCWYFHAFNLGRYSQSISIVNALRQGIGGKIQESLTRTLELASHHAEAHTAFGLYHSEIIEKIGKMIGSMTYGASVEKAIEHFEEAISLTPESPIAHIEYGNGLYMLYGDKKLDEITELYVKATEMTPRDAMEKLDVEMALAELE